MDLRRVLVATLLSLAVLLAWQAFFAPPPGPAPEAPAPEVEAPAEQAPVVPARPSPPAAAGPELEAGADAGPEPGPAPVAAAAEERVVLENRAVRAEFTNRGAQLLSFELKTQRTTTGERVDLVRRRGAPPYPFALVAPGPARHPLGEALYAVERDAGPVGASGVTFRYAGAEGRAEKRFVLDPEDPLFTVAVEAVADGELAVYLGPGLRNPSPEEIANRFARRSGVWSAAGEIERRDAAGADESEAVDGTGVRWVGLEDSYFLAAWRLDSPLARFVLRPVLVLPGAAAADNDFRYLAPDEELDGDEEDLPRELALLLYPAGPRLAGEAYWGAKQHGELARHGFEGAVDLGFFAILAKPLLYGLQWIYDNLVGNYGWAIILMTALIRILLFPLTHKSFTSMQKMQELNPKMQAIRQKYRGKLKTKQGRPNPEAQRKMNEEIMALYKQEGVNPAGGCVPMLLQIPVLFAFYRLLSSAFELRQAPWILWIDDLSAPDPYYVLPIVMGASQFVQQKLTPSAADPMQRRIFMLMPIFFTVLFLGFPSGLVLYWLTNNVLGIAQQALYRRRGDAAPEPAGKAAGSGGGKARS